MYDVRRDAAGGMAAATGGVCDCGSEKADGVEDGARCEGGDVAVGVDEDEVAVDEPKSPRISSTVLRWDWGGEAACAGPEDKEVDEPKISARKSCVVAAGWPLTDPAVGVISSPKRSPCDGKPVSEWG